jgi:hypothetical protein
MAEYLTTGESTDSTISVYSIHMYIFVCREMLATHFFQHSLLLSVIHAETSKQEIDLHDSASPT